MTYHPWHSPSFIFQLDGLVVVVVMDWANKIKSSLEGSPEQTPRFPLDWLRVRANLRLISLKSSHHFTSSDSSRALYRVFYRLILFLSSCFHLFLLRASLQIVPHTSHIECFTSADIICYKYYFHNWQCAHHLPHVTAFVKCSARTRSACRVGAHQGAVWEWVETAA
jgi:hypothetical protein